MGTSVESRVHACVRTRDCGLLCRWHHTKDISAILHLLSGLPRKVSVAVIGRNQTKYHTGYSSQQLNTSHNVHVHAVTCKRRRFPKWEATGIAVDARIQGSIRTVGDLT